MRKLGEIKTSASRVEVLLEHSARPLARRLAVDALTAEPSGREGPYSLAEQLKLVTLWAFMGKAGQPQLGGVALKVRECVEGPAPQARGAGWLDGTCPETPSWLLSSLWQKLTPG